MIASSLPHKLLDQHDRNQLQRGYSAQLPSLNFEKQNLNREFNRLTLSTTYRDELLGHGTNGDLTLHYGNYAHCGKHERIPTKNNFLTDYTKSASAIKPFLTPSYQNLTQSVYMSERLWKNYSNNYRTSEDNVNFNRLNPLVLPHQTHLPQFFKTKIKPIAKVDEAAVYKQEAINGHVNDYFHSKKYVKSEMMTVRDNFANAMQFFDYLRNKRYDSNTRKLFKEDLNENEIDIYADYFSQYINEIKNMMRYMDSLNNRALDLKKMLEGFLYTEKIVDCNLLDENAKPVADRRYHFKTENSIIKDKKVIVEAKDFGNKVLSETQILLNAMKLISNEIVNNVLEEVKKIFVEKIDNKAYQRDYIRDTNGYIKQDAKAALSIEAWKKLADDTLFQIRCANDNANKLIFVITETIDQLSEDVSKQVMNTHEIVKNQIEDDLKAQGNLLTQQKDLRRELSEINEAIGDTRRKLGTCEMQNEFNLTQLTSVMPNVDIVNDIERKSKIASTNRIWSCVTDLRHNLNDMNKHKRILEDTIQKNDTALKSSHVGIDYDWRTFANPRRHATAVQPAVDLVNQAVSTFF